MKNVVNNSGRGGVEVISVIQKLDSEQFNSEVKVVVDKILASIS